MYLIRINGHNTLHFLYIACNVTELGDNTSLLSNVSCDSPFNSVGIKDGLACYRNADVGSTAIYFCLECGFSTVQGLSTRTCLPNGSWTGQIPQCQCDTGITPTNHTPTSPFSTISTMSLFRHIRTESTK